jgi:localization factor PodJL
MKPGIPWSVKGIEPEVREVAKHAARRAGMTLGEWLNTVILDQNDPADGSQGSPEGSPPKDFLSSGSDPAATLRREEPPTRRDEPSRRPETSIRLEDIAHQLSQLAQRERESASILPYEAPRPRNEDRDTLNRILSRIDSNERQAVEAFTAMNERLSVLGRQIATSSRARSIEKPEDVPGFAALEQAIRNVVEHIEVSEKRTRDSLKSMQDRLGDMAARASTPNSPDDLVRAAPAFASLEGRIADLAGRMQRSENLLNTGLPDVVRKELNQLADRIETVQAAAEQSALQAQNSASGIARAELRDIEGRILGVLKEAQATIGSQQSTIADLQKLRSEIGGLNKRIDEVRQSTANDRDVHALRVAVEQLSTRVAQGTDMRPLAEMERRLGDLSQRLDHNNAATRNLPQFGELERRIAELDHRLVEAMRLQGDQKAVKALEQHIADVSERVSRTEEQLGHLETMEQAIHRLYEGLEQNRAHIGQTAEDAANRAVERLLAAQAQAGPSPELRAMEEGLRAVRESAAGADQRNQETLEAVHETLEQIVNKLAELETASAGHQLAANMAHQASGHAQTGEKGMGAHTPTQAAATQFFDPTGIFEPPTFEQRHEVAAAASPEETAGQYQNSEPVPANQLENLNPAIPPQSQTSTPDFSAGASAAIPGGDDFIAAARRAAQAAASRPAAAPTELKQPIKLDEGKGLKLPFLKRKPQPITFVNGQPVVEKPAVPDSKRKKLMLAGLVLLAAVSAITFNMVMGRSKPVKQSTLIEQPFSSAPAPTANPTQTLNAQSNPVASAQNLPRQEYTGAIKADALITGSLPAKKTDATIASIVGQPGEARSEMPPAEAGPQALREAAARGDARAQFIVASRYLDGQGVAQDLPKAAYWYQQAASRGLAPAQYRLATLFERGKGVPQDAATAMLWYERAAEGGNIKAMHNAAVIAAGSENGTPNYDKAFKWFNAAAERGLHDSQFNLAVLFERGLGTPVDKPQAYLWYSMAAKQGDADAAKRADGLLKALTETELRSVNTRIASWVPKSSPDEANLVALTDPAWNDGASAAVVTESTEAVSLEAIPEAADPNPIAEAQQLLSKLGFNIGVADGKMGSRTANAIRLFQLQSGMKVTGSISSELLETMRAKAGA